jgi:hypothetical protein
MSFEAAVLVLLKLIEYYIHLLIGYLNHFLFSCNSPYRKLGQKRYVRLTFLHYLPIRGIIGTEKDFTR